MYSEGEARLGFEAYLEEVDDVGVHEWLVRAEKFGNGAHPFYGLRRRIARVAAERGRHGRGSRGRGKRSARG